MKMFGAAALLLISFELLAYDSGIAVQIEKGTTMQVYVNGKLFNKQSGNFLRVRSTPGLFHLEVKVMNPWNKLWYVIKKDIRVEKGYEFQYKIVFVNRYKPELREVKKYPMYSKFFLNNNLYNKHPTA
ncbi:hypothetical protein [Chryseolinea sp. H1M3-3]|uniref:hypothetical protein n=1 Tax=Chryseolinea sp. H1M3-3 TaxID=3034144 RepID=UPI0023ECB4D1|nr:hypothetical protein [Chryseolinea sp. H1M3-3]